MDFRDIQMLPYGLDSNVTKLLANLIMTKPIKLLYILIIYTNYKA